MTSFASRRPVTFALAMALLLLAAYVAAGVAAALSAHDVAGQRTVEAFGRLAAMLLFLWMLHRLDWQDGAGITRAGSSRIWLLALLVLTYRVVAQLLVFFGGVGLSLPDPALAGAVALNGAAAGALEEVVFRGIVLYGLLLAWSESGRGWTKAVLLTSLIFGASHLIRIVFGQPLPEVSLLALDGFVAGILFAAFTLHSRSVWPAVAIHSGVNAMVGAWAVGVPGSRETVGAWLLILLLELPVLVLSLFLLRRRD